MKGYIIYFFIVFSLFFVACKYELTFEKKTVDNKFSVEIPDYMSKCNDLSNKALLQYKNKYRTIYFIVLEYGLTGKSAETVIQSAIDELVDNLTEPEIVKIDTLEINRRQGLQYRIEGKVDDKLFVYLLTFVPSDNRLYQLTIWTLEEKFDKYVDDFNKIIHSFNEI